MRWYTQPRTTGDRAIVNWNLTSSNKVNHVILAITFEDYFQHKGGQNSFSSGDNFNAMAGLGFVNQTGGAAITAGGYYLGGGSSINKDSHEDGRFGDDFTWVNGSHEAQFGVSVLRYYTIGSQGGYHPPPFGSFRLCSVGNRPSGKHRYGICRRKLSARSGGLGRFCSESRASHGDALLSFICTGQMEDSF